MRCVRGEVSQALNSIVRSQVEMKVSPWSSASPYYLSTSAKVELRRWGTYYVYTWCVARRGMLKFMHTCSHRDVLRSKTGSVPDRIHEASCEDLARSQKSRSKKSLEQLWFDRARVHSEIIHRSNWCNTIERIMITVGGVNFNKKFIFNSNFKHLTIGNISIVSPPCNLNILLWI